MEPAGSAPAGSFFSGARRWLRNVYFGRCTMLAPGALRTARLFGCPERIEDALAEGGKSLRLGRFCLIFKEAVAGGLAPCLRRLDRATTGVERNTEPYAKNQNTRC